MIPKRSFESSEMKYFSFVLLAFFGVILVIITPSYAAIQEKIPTTISISIDPANPGTGDDFMVTGVLTTSSGEILGNKYVYLDSTKAGAQWGTLQPLWQGKTDTTGAYSFYRPITSPAEELRVRFDGTYKYGNSTSEVISINK
jgi:hypothetical protein